MTKPVVDVKNVQKVYGKKGENQSHALKGVSFSIQEGEFVGIMGPSGSGKTTLLNVISTLDKATGGVVEIYQRFLHFYQRFFKYIGDSYTFISD
ncbi:ATP-binding cassette domain-containing protein, partial [Bacillus thuringiensis]|nr:ATP-binding cassette domain-containing protein [Bacillus thuringiensis]